MSHIAEPKLSASRIRTYLDCPHEYRLRYLDGVAEEPPSSPLVVGSLVHRALELLVRDGVAAREEALARAIEHYAPRAPTPEEYADALALVRDAELPSQGVVSVTEHEFEIGLGEGGVVLRGYMDRVDFAAGGAVAIVDYKTGRTIPSRSEVEADLQLGCYALAARELWPGRSVSLRLVLARHGTTIETTRTAQQLDDLRDYLLAIHARIVAEAEWSPRLSTRCAWCLHRGDCEAYRQALAGDDHELAAVGGDLGTAEDVAVARETLATRIRLLEDERGRLDERLRAEIEASNDGEIVAGGRRYSLGVTRRTTYPPLPALRVLAEAGASPGQTGSVLRAPVSEVSRVVRELCGRDRARRAEIEQSLREIATVDLTPRLTSRGA